MTNNKAKDLGVTDVGVATTKAMLDGIADLMDAGNYPHARKRLEELRIVISGRTVGWMIRDPDTNKYASNGQSFGSLSTAKIWSNVGHMKNSIRARIWRSPLDNWARCQIISPNGTVHNLAKWCAENMDKRPNANRSRMNELIEIGEKEK